MGFEQKRIEFSNGMVIVFGLNDTRAEVATEYPAVPIGSIYINAPAAGGTGRVYIKTAHTGSAVAADWTKVTTSAAD